MLRTIQTAIYLFKNHPLKETIKFILLPLIKEGLHLSNDCCRTFDKIEELIKPLENEYGITFEKTYMNLYGE